ncbi:MAG: tRNA-dihydrouridine synthase [Clostridia bacterium]|nr:tRNA-dihydrouridine synthase [Clostridia bacterium]
MKIKDIKLKNNLALAPMAGYTDIALREMCARSGAGLTVTEMVSAKGLVYQPEKNITLLRRSPYEEVASCQLFGNDPLIMVEALKHPQVEQFDIIDINMGCPAPKIIKNKEGSYLLNDFKTASLVCDTLAKNTQKPITCKMRIGFKNDKIVATDFAKMLEDSGASAICVHGRTTEQGYMGEPNLLEIEKVKSKVQIPVFGNGNVCDQKSLERMLETGVDGVMIGRGALGNPFIFCDLLNIERPPIDNPALMHIELLEPYVPERILVFELRKTLCYYCTKEQKLQLMKIDNLIDLKNFAKGLKVIKHI